MRPVATFGPLELARTNISISREFVFHPYDDGLLTWGGEIVFKPGQDIRPDELMGGPLEYVGSCRYPGGLVRVRGMAYLTEMSTAVRGEIQGVGALVIEKEEGVAEYRLKDDALVHRTAGELRKFADECPEARDWLERHVPEAFEREQIKFKVGGLYLYQGGPIYQCVEVNGRYALVELGGTRLATGTFSTLEALSKASEFNGVVEVPFDVALRKLARRRGIAVPGDDGR